MQSITTKTKTSQAQTGKSKKSPVDKRLKALDIAMKRNHHHQHALIEILHKAQESFGYLEPEILQYIARQLKLPLSRVYGVATFYHLFSLNPSGVHSCVVCLGTACYVKGGGKITSAIEEELGIHAGETTSDKQVSLMTARCIGACGIAPAVVFDDIVTGKQEPEKVLQKIKAWQSEVIGD
ncbi:MAG: bidirectional hydrogenase complex protein HoxE [Xenococcaceae cyanobacterium MO_167.B52]|nr:bidirectional hydrogenase complex protein HoxE [Xenococcaceae cyanobacterium MO_167.B52]